MRGLGLFELWSKLANSAQPKKISEFGYEWADLLTENSLFPTARIAEHICPLIPPENFTALQSVVRRHFTQELLLEWIDDLGEYPFFEVVMDGFPETFLGV